MEWRGRRGSSNIEDRRGEGGGGVARGGMGKVGGVGMIAVLLIGWFLGIDVSPLLQDGGMTAPSSSGAEITDEDRQMGEFVSVTLADTEEIWADLFRRQLNARYSEPTLVLFKGYTQSPCGGASEATGPFYCPGDQKVYLDTDFFRTLDQQLGAGGDFAAAYVIAHEVGHHVENELGILEKVNRIRQQVSEAEANEYSVRIELMADCLAGVWANAAADQLGTIERGDVQEAMNAAQQIGDDTLQRNAGQRPMPDSFTHGTSAQRMRWFERGWDGGLIKQCDTFSAARL